MLNRFLNGLLFGAGFSIPLAISLVLVTIFAQQVLPPTKVQFVDEIIGDEEISENVEGSTGIPITASDEHSQTDESNPPSSTPATAPQKENTFTGSFLGRLKIFSGGTDDDFSSKNSSKGLISGGPGLIVGQVFANNFPASGLKIKLTLNGGISTQWMTTNSEGAYELNLPYGEYRVDGYEIDKETADQVLAGMIDHPQLAPLSGTIFDVRKGLNSRGPTFRFVSPIIKRVPKNVYRSGEQVQISWTAYPGAKLYTVQVYEKSKKQTGNSRRELFSRSARPSMTDTFINLNSHDVDLKPGYLYTVEIVARNEKISIVSKTPEPGSGYDFEISR